MHTFTTIQQRKYVALLAHVAAELDIPLERVDTILLGVSHFTASGNVANREEFSLSGHVVNTTQRPDEPAAAGSTDAPVVTDTGQHAGPVTTFDAPAAPKPTKRAARKTTGDTK